jgi:hypothetical protein
VVKTDALPDRQVGTTLVCPQCNLAVVIVESGHANEAAMTCHTTMKPARPMRCWRQYPRPAGAAMVAGALYTDELSGLTVRCTRAGSGAVSLAGRALTCSVRSTLVTHTSPSPADG